MEYSGSINSQYSPTIFSTPFAANGARNTIATAPTGTNNASQSEGFPAITAQPITNGGIPPSRGDMNAIGYDAQSWGYYIQCGGVAVFDNNVMEAIGGYPQGARLWVSGTTQGTVVVRAKQLTQTNPANTITDILAGTDPNWAVDLYLQPVKIFPNWSQMQVISLSGIGSNSATWQTYTMPFNGWLNIWLTNWDWRNIIIDRMIGGQWTNLYTFNAYESSGHAMWNIIEQSGAQYRFRSDNTETTGAATIKACPLM